MKGVTPSDEPVVNYHRNVQLPSASWGFMLSFSSLFSVLLSSSRLQQKEAIENALYTPAQRQTSDGHSQRLARERGGAFRS